MAEQRLQIQVSNDGSEARARISPGAAADEEALRGALEEAGVVHGIDDAACARLGLRLADPRFEGESEPIARATAAQAGEDGRLEMFVEMSLRPGRPRSDGSLDLRDREFLKCVRAGDRIAVRLPPSSGNPGQRVDAVALPVEPGRPDPTALGPGVRESQSGEIVALQDGAVTFQAGKSLDVVTHHIHAGDVDIRSGHLEMSGSLCIRGSVAPGFRARADRDLEVTAAVDGGIVRAGGDILVRGGVLGGENGSVTAGGSAVVRHVQDARIRCEGILEIQATAVSSLLKAREIQIGGRLQGGEAQGEIRVSVLQAGSALGAGAVLATAEPLAPLVDAARSALDAAKVRRRTRRPRKDGAGASASPKRGKSGRQKRQVESQQLRQIREVQRRRRELLPIAVVDVRKIAHAGVEVRFATHRLHLEEPVRAVRFRFDAESREIIQETLES